MLLGNFLDWIFGEHLENESFVDFFVEFAWVFDICVKPLGEFYSKDKKFLFTSINITYGLVFDNIYVTNIALRGK